MLTNQYIHDLNRLHYLCGPVVEVVSCTLANVGHPGIEVEDACTAVVRFANGAYGELSLGLYSQPGLSGYEIIGDRGCIVKRGEDQRYARLSSPLDRIPTQSDPGAPPARRDARRRRATGGHVAGNSPGHGAPRSGSGVRAGDSATTRCPTRRRNSPGAISS